MSRFQEQLKRQMGFLERSSASFDLGYTDEAVRMATTIRILMHDTRSQVSLLTHLGAWGIHLLSTCRQASPNAVLFSGMGIHEIGPEGGRLRPNLGDDETWSIPAKDWWNQVIFVLPPGVRITRGQLVLTAANKDGGAHVDPKLTPPRALTPGARNLPPCGLRRIERSDDINSLTAADVRRQIEVAEQHLQWRKQWPAE